MTTERLLVAAREGDENAQEQLMELVYGELKRIARAQLRKGPRGSFNTTELVHEAYLKLDSGAGAKANDRPHFLALAARAMRQVLIDHFRAQRAEKRGGPNEPETLGTVDGAVRHGRGDMILAIHAALERLEVLDPRLARVVECKFFGGMKETEVAAALGLAKRTVSRDWRQAKAWLARELQER